MFKGGVWGAVMRHLQVQCMCPSAGTFAFSFHLINSSPLFCSVSWCVVSDAEEQKCLDLAGNATALHIRGALQCVRGLNTRDCINKIKVPGKKRDGKVDCSV